MALVADSAAEEAAQAARQGGEGLRETDRLRFDKTSASKGLTVASPKNQPVEELLQCRDDLNDLSASKSDEVETRNAELQETPEAIKNQ